MKIWLFILLILCLYILAASAETSTDVQSKLKALEAAPGVKVIDDPANEKYPLQLDAEGVDEVFVGRVREDISQEKGLDLWCVADNIRKGAATNAVQIAELLAK